MFVLKGKCYFRGISLLPNVILHKPSKHSTLGKTALKWNSTEEMSEVKREASMKIEKGLF